MIENPILPGFNPDPSICRVGGDYFVATSTFEWYPGVQIHHSTNLVDWRLVTRPLRRASQLDLRGDPDSCGVWAPCLSHADRRFWLVYTDVKRYDGAFKDAHNYLVTASDITGDWSDPVHVNSSGFDPSLFHDADGRKWFLNLVWNHRATAHGPSPRRSPFGGIALQEYDAAAGRLVGESRIVFTGSPRGLAEGPHLFRHDGWYFLVVAEGGTGYAHAVTHARSRAIEGPYALHPDVHVITADPAGGGALQRAGHGQPVETPGGEWYHTHLCARPLDVTDPARRRSPLGRETAIQRCEWGEDGWLRLAHGSAEPALEVAAPRGTDAVAGRSGDDGERRDGHARHEDGHDGDERRVDGSGDDSGDDGSRGDGDDGGDGHGARTERVAIAAANAARDAHAGAAPSPVDGSARRHRFDGAALPLDFQWPRTPDWQRLFSLDARADALRLYGRESIGSHFEQSLVARRQQHRAYRATTTLELAPASFQHGAGLVAWYDRHRFHFLHVTHDEALGRVLTVASGTGDWPDGGLLWPLDAPLALDGAGPVSLRCEVDGAALRFSWRGRDTWLRIGPVLDASLLSDEAGRGEHASFTGAFVGMLAFDVSGGGRHADFLHFDYEPRA